MLCVLRYLRSNAAIFFANFSFPTLAINKEVLHSYISTSIAHSFRIQKNSTYKWVIKIIQHLHIIWQNHNNTVPKNRIRTHKNTKNNIHALGKHKTEIDHEFDYENEKTVKNLKKIIFRNSSSSNCCIRNCPKGSSSSDGAFKYFLKEK